jgi:hypothetical protein
MSDDASDEGLPTAHNARVLECDNCNDLVLASHKQTLDEMHNTECLRCEEGLLQIQRRDVVRRADIIKKLKSSIKASIKYRDRHVEGSELWKYHNHGATEKLDVLRFVVGKKPQNIESHLAENMLQELLEEVKGKASKSDSDSFGETEQ